MLDEMRANPKLQDEYENTFDSEEKISNALKIAKDTFTIDVGVVEFESILVSGPIKKGRKETYLGLAKSVGEMGIISPIHVMVTEGYATAIENGIEDYPGPKYVLLDGFRRVWSGYKNGLDRCNAVIWDFKDKDKGVELSTVLSMVLNKVQKRSWGEIWYLYQILEVQSAMTPGTLEYLLQMEPGDAMRLKDIMSCEYPDVKDELLSNKKNIMQAYNMLQKYRKEEDRLQKEDDTGISELEQAEGVIEDGGDTKLSDDDVKSILEMEDSYAGDLSEDEFDALMGNNLESDVFEVDGDRHLDPALRSAVLQRDNYTCQVSGIGIESGLPTDIALAILQVHHKVPVADGGPNDMENLITIAQDPHTLVHVIQRRGGKLGMSKEEFEKLPEKNQEYLKKVMQLVRIAVDADKKCGKTREQVKKDTQESLKYKMPGLIQKENMQAIKDSKKAENN